MGVPNSDVGYTSTTTERGDHEVHKGHVVALEKKIIKIKADNYMKCNFISEMLLLQVDVNHVTYISTTGMCLYPVQYVLTQAATNGFCLYGLLQK
jgi:hypothetical protein